MFSFLVSSSFSSSIILSEENYSRVFNTSSLNSVFVYVYDSWCKECEKIELIWNNVSENAVFNKNINFASLNCDSNKKLCKEKFDPDNFPSFYWFNGANSAYELYSGNITDADISSFIKNELKHPIKMLKKVENFTDLRSAIKKTKNLNNYDQSFIFNISSSDNSYLKLAKQVTRKLKELPVLFFFVNDTINAHHEPILHTISGTERIIMESDFTAENIESFIRRKSFPLLAQFSTSIDEYCKLNKIPVAIFVHPDEELSNVTETAQIIERYMITTQTNCIINPYVCRYCNQWPKNGKGFIAVLNRSSRTFWVFDKEYDRNDINHFVDDISEHQLKGYGPGPGVIGNVLSLYYDLRERGGMPYYTAHVPIIVLTVIGAITLHFTGDKIAAKYESIMEIREAERTRKEQIAELERKKRNRMRMKGR